MDLSVVNSVGITNSHFILYISVNLRELNPSFFVFSFKLKTITTKLCSMLAVSEYGPY